MNERTGLVTLMGNPVTLLGAAVEVGQPAPDFRVVDAGFKTVQLSSFKGKTVLISAVPSLDTPVCAIQTKRFNESAAKLGSKVAVLTVSMDLPFAQKRFCEAEKIAGIQVLSDCAWREFGMNYGLLIKNMGLLARCVMVVSAAGKLAYMERVPEITNHPDYDKSLAALA